MILNYGQCAVNMTGKIPDDYITIGSYNTAIGKYNGAVTMDSGKVLCVPGNRTNARFTVFDQADNSLTDTGSVIAVANQWAQAYRMDNGNYFCTPRAATNAAIWNEANNNFTLSTGGNNSGTNKHWSSVKLPDGRFYCIPYANTKASLVSADGSTMTDNIGATTLTGTSPYYGDGIMLDANTILLIPAVPAQFAKVSISNNFTITPFGTNYGTGTAKFTKALRLPSGKILVVNKSHPQAVLYDPLNNSQTYIGNSNSTAQKYDRAELLADGTVFCNARAAAQCRILDPVTGTDTNVGTVDSNGAKSYATALLKDKSGVLIAPADTAYFKIWGRNS